MAKRGATREINHDNWDQEDETEEAGVFKQADEEALKGRQIRKAKRRTAADGGESEAGTLGAFKGFTGFTSINTKAPTFSFNKDSSIPLGGLANGSSGVVTSTFGGAPAGGFKIAPLSVGSEQISSFSFSSQAVSKTDSTKPTSPQKTDLGKSSAIPTTNGTGKSGSRTKYLQSLKALNESVSKWIMQHVDKNAHCILTPIFKDYERHLADIEKLNPDKDSSANSEQEDSHTSKSVNQEPTPTTSAGSASTISTALTSTTTTTSASATSSIPTTTFKFTPSGPSSTTSTVSTGSLFGGAQGGFTLGQSKTTPFSFATGATSSSSTSSSTQGGQADEEYVPPQTEVTEVKEEGAFYSKRCKLYYQKDGSWVEKGLGNLHLKTCGEKTQMIIRADTNLGNILLNIMLSSSLPMSRQGKNNVSMMCIPNPPLDPKMEASKPVSMLLKVKTTQDADELLEKLEESRK